METRTGEYLCLGGSPIPTNEEIAFHEAMIDLYKRAKKEANYPANYFLQKVNESGGFIAARDWLSDPNEQTGFTELVLRRRIDLTMEAMILDSDRWIALFNDTDK